MDKLLSKKQVMECLNIKPRLLGYLIKEKEIPAVRIGRGRGIIRVKESDLEAYIERKRSFTTQTREEKVSQ